jgi:hypothetical protein
MFFFHESVSSRLLSNPAEKLFSGVNDTSEKFFAGVNDTGDKTMMNIVPRRLFFAAQQRIAIT